MRRLRPGGVTRDNGAVSAAAKPAAPKQAGPKQAGPKQAGAPRKASAMPLADVRAFLEALARVNPAPRSELLYADPFTLLVAVVLSAQATDASVNRVTPGLFAAAPTPEAMAALGPEGIARHIRSIGLWQSKARNVAALAGRLVDTYGGAVPANREALESLPGVGRKTANVVLNVAFGESTMAVDTHVFRLGNRTGIAPGRTPRAVEDALVRRVPKEMLRDAHHWLILHGRYVCKARTPECWRCVGSEWCRYPAKTPPPVEKPPRKG
jgi:endonuclease-3